GCMEIVAAFSLSPLWIERCCNFANQCVQAPTLEACCVRLDERDACLFFNSLSDRNLAKQRRLPHRNNYRSTTHTRQLLLSHTRHRAVASLANFESLLNCASLL